MKRINLLIVLLFVVIANALGQLRVSGYVFEEEGGKYIARVPFASVYYYNYEDTTKVEFFSFTDMHGGYNLYDMQTGKYHVEIVAPGYETKRQKIIIYNAEQLALNNNNQVVAHISMKKNTDEEIMPTIYMVKDILQTEDDNLESLINSLKEKTKKENRTTKNRRYKLWLGGEEVDVQSYNKINEVPFSLIIKKVGDENLEKTSIEYYDFSGIKNCLVKEIFNVVVNGMSQRPTDETGFIPTETTDFFIQE